MRNETTLARLIATSVAKVKAMSPEERAKMHEEQRRSWVRGQVGFGSDRDEAKFRAAIERADG